MLHEILIVLAGYESSVITDAKLSSDLLHPSEQALTSQIALFGKLHRDISRRIKVIQSSFMELPLADREYAKSFFPGPYSSASHAIASTLDRVLLGPFRECLVEIEKRILDRDSAYVGGENVVSLSLIVVETVRRWERRFMYSHALLGFITGNGMTSTSTGSIVSPTRGDISSNEGRPPVPSVHEIIDKLRKDEIIGYQDVKELVHRCLIAVERSWLAQLSSWVLYGRLPRNCSDEFMIAKRSSETTRRYGHDEFYLRESHIPSSFMSSSIANEIFVIGDCLSKMNIFNNQGRSNVVSSINHYSFDMKTIGDHNEILFSTELPISESQFQRNITTIRFSVFKNVVASTLPISNIIQLFNLLRRIVLSGSFEFVNSFLANVEIEKKHGVANRVEGSPPFDPKRIFNRSCVEYTEDTTNQSDRDLLDLCTRLIDYQVVNESRQSSNAGQFDDLLLGIRCKLILTIDWPLNILISSREEQFYGALFSYFMAIRSSIKKLQDLWREYRIYPSRSARAPIASQAKVFLDHLWDYLQSYVIDPNFNQLLTVIANESEQEQVDPQTIISCHSKVVRNIYSESFIGDIKMRSYLRDLLISCSILCESDNLEDNSTLSFASQRISAAINSIILYLGQQENMTPAISQLMVRLDATHVSSTY